MEGSKLIRAIVAISMVLFLAASSGTSFAQYPDQTVSVACEGSVTVSQTNATIEITATVLDVNGVPVAGETVEFSIVDPPGSSASLSDPSGETDAGGIARTTLFTGATPGQQTVSCDAEMESEFVAEVQGVSTFVPPTTGDAGLVR